MGKVSPKNKQSKTSKQKKRLRNSNRFLKPGALAQLRYNKAASAKSCTDIGKKRVALFDGPSKGSDVALVDQALHQSPSMMLSPKRFDYSPMTGCGNMVHRNSILGTPKTPAAMECDSDSRLESLPMDLLVQILCQLHHDQLRPVFHVSQRIRTAVQIARQIYFNYTTPDRSRLEMLSNMTPLPTEHWPFLGKGDGMAMIRNSPLTPKAPRHGPRPPLRFKHNEMRPISVVLFQENAFPSRCIVPSVLSKPICRSLASNRVLFNEDELCQAVAQNKLL